MKVYIITMPLLSNFGGILQNYALQATLKEMGHIPITVDIDPSPSKLRYVLRSLKSFLKGNFSLPDSYKRNASIQSFLDENLLLTKRVRKPSMLGGYDDADAFIVGSDQIWRYSYNKQYIYDVYLGFSRRLSCKRIAYAASFGTNTWDYPPKVTTKCSELLSLFNGVSVREEAGVDMCKRYLNYDAKQVLDPTLLVEKEKYVDLCKDIPPQKEILVAYILDGSEDKINFVKRVANEKNLEPVIITEKRANGISVYEWIAYLRDASFVITDSYHGTVFSIIFEKDFLSLQNRKRGSERFISLLAPLSLDSRLINETNYNINPEPINWLNVNSIKNRLIEESKSYLIKQL